MFPYDYNLARYILDQRVEETLRKAERDRLIQAARNQEPKRIMQPKRILQWSAIVRFKRLLPALTQKTDANPSITSRSLQAKCNDDLASCSVC